MRLLVTGGCGFIGSNFINYFFDKTEILVNLDAMYYCASSNYIQKNIREHSNYTFIKGQC